MIGNRNIAVLKTFGIHLRDLRIKAGLSQSDLANSAEIPISQISRIERGLGNPTLSTLDSLSVALNIQLSDLVNFKP